MESNPQVRDPSHLIRGCIPPVWSQNFSNVRLTAPENHAAYENELAVSAYCRQHGRYETINNMPYSDMLKLGCGPLALLADQARENLACAVDVLISTAESSTSVSSSSTTRDAELSSTAVPSSSSAAAKSSTSVASSSTTRGAELSSTAVASSSSAAAKSSTAVASKSRKTKKRAMTSNGYAFDNMPTSLEALITGRQHAVDIMLETVTRRFDISNAAPPFWVDLSFALLSMLVKPGTLILIA